VVLPVTLIVRVAESVVTKGFIASGMANTYVRAQAGTVANAPKVVVVVVPSSTTV
jgi:hypothetical protein